MKRAICRSRSAKCISAFYDITATDSTLSHFFARSPKLADSNSGPFRSYSILHPSLLLLTPDALR